MSKSLADQAYDILEDKIVRLEYKPGELISENQLSKELNFGRMPMREAIKRLEKAHLIKIMPRRGMMITEIKLDEIYLQTEVRRVLERLIVTRATKFATAEEKEKLLELAEEYVNATKNNDPDESMRVDNEFNHLIAKAAKNQYAEASILPLLALARRLYYFYYNKDEEHVIEINMAHVDLMREIAKGDIEEAVKISDHIIDLILDLYKDNYFMNI